MSPDLIRNFEIVAKIRKLVRGLIALACCAGSGPAWLPLATAGCSAGMVCASIKTGGYRYVTLINKKINRVAFGSRE